MKVQNNFEFLVLSFGLDEVSFRNKLVFSFAPPHEGFSLLTKVL